MTRIHDMGGRFGHGPVKPSTLRSPKFEEPWHARALALTLAAGALGRWNQDSSRHSRERLPPNDYARFSYYEKWLAALAELLVQRNIVSKDELSAPESLPQQPLDGNALKGPEVAGALAKIEPTARKTGHQPRFRAGRLVRTRRPSGNMLVSGGHTRLPAYAAGCLGTVVRCHGSHVLPDSNAHFRGEAPEPLYAVSFESSELWGNSNSSSNDEIVLDLWESYLIPTD
ncbi:MAG: nitrile hydratase subunit beta [Albidovulum sp.]|nr:nitrile hydratase subunit beta [Albidovulum sp.]